MVEGIVLIMWKIHYLKLNYFKVGIFYQKLLNPFDIPKHCFNLLNLLDSLNL